MTATTVYEKIEKLKTIKNDLKTNIESYGVTVGTAPFDEYPAKVLEIPTTDSIKTLIDAVNEESGGAAIQDSIDLVESNYTDIKAAITAAGVDMSGVKPSGYGDKIINAIYERLFTFNAGTGEITDFPAGLVYPTIIIPSKVMDTDVVGIYGFWGKNVEVFITKPGATVIRDNGVRQNIGLTEVSLAPTLINIGIYAFYGCPVVKIALGANVSIANDPSFPTMGVYGNEFLTLYNGNGRLAGTYKYAGGTWTKTA